MWVLACYQSQFGRRDEGVRGEGSGKEDGSLSRDGGWHKGSLDEAVMIASEG